jgi:hypothetical protein
VDSLVDHCRRAVACVGLECDTNPLEVLNGSGVKAGLDNGLALVEKLEVDEVSRRCEWPYGWYGLEDGSSRGIGLEFGTRILPLGAGVGGKNREDITASLC